MLSFYVRIFLVLKEIVIWIRKRNLNLFMLNTYFSFLVFLLSSTPDIAMGILIGLDFSDRLIAVIILGLNGLIIRFVYKNI